MEASCTSWLSWCYVFGLGGWAMSLMASSWACVSALSPQVEKWLQSQTTWRGQAAGEVWGGGGWGKPWKTSPKITEEAKHNHLFFLYLSFCHVIIWCLFPSKEQASSVLASMLQVLFWHFYSANSRKQSVFTSYLISTFSMLHHLTLANTAPDNRTLSILSFSALCDRCS